jgi:hypothetical protein
MEGRRRGGETARGEVGIKLLPIAIAIAIANLCVCFFECDDDGHERTLPISVYQNFSSYPFLGSHFFEMFISVDQTLRSFADGWTCHCAGLRYAFESFVAIRTQLCVAS